MLSTAWERKGAPSWTASSTDTSGMGASVRAVNAGQLPSFDLVVATVDRVADLKRLLASLGRQTHPHFRVLLVDQNDDDRLDAPLSDRPLPWLTRLRAPRGLSHARNVALREIRADVVAFPDDDCVYPDDLLERIARRFGADPALDGLTGRAL